MNGFDETFDFVIVGNGGGSMCAGLVMRKAGRSVLIVEKTGLAGGTTARSGGVLWIPNNRFMKRDGIADSAELANTYLDNLVGDHNDTPGASRVRRRTYVAEGTKMIDFLVEQGIKLDRIARWPDYHDELPGGLEAGRAIAADLFDVNELGPWARKLRPNYLQMAVPLEDAFKLPFFKQSWAGFKAATKVVLRTALAKVTGRHWVTCGAALQGRMLQAALKAGVEIRLESPVGELIEENGKVVGILTRKDGRPWRIGSRLGVLVNAGGFAHNEAMRAQYQPGASARWTNAAEGDTGEMILEMQGHGAAIAQMEEMVGNQMSIPPGMEDEPVKPAVQGMTARPSAIVVDQSGVRYMNESGSYMKYCQNMIARDRDVPAIPSWGVFDSKVMDNDMVAGSMPGSKKPDAWYESGFLKKADTIEELAAMLHLDPGTLRATVDRYNDFAKRGVDEDFHRGERQYDRWLVEPLNRPLPMLKPLDKGPFYAVPVVPGDVGTYGGVVTDEKARVLRKDGTVIDGLYATGVSTASVMGRAYPGPGASVGPSFTWGYVAARDALAAGAARP